MSEADADQSAPQRARCYTATIGAQSQEAGNVRTTAMAAVDCSGVECYAR